MSFDYSKKLKPYSRQLRAEMTREERKLWFDFLCRLPIKIRRQKMIGNYILDFYCASKKIAIELDGSQHYETIEHEKDEERDNMLNKIGITVLRYGNNEVNNNFNGVCNDILTKLGLMS